MAGSRAVFIAAAACLCVVPGQSAAFPGLAGTSGGDPCISDCLAARRARNSLIVTARNSAGRILKVVSLELPAGAREVSQPLTMTGAAKVCSSRISASGLCNGMRPAGRCALQPGYCVQTHVRVYAVSTDYLIHAYVSLFRSGELMEFWIDQFRVARAGKD